MISEIKQFGTVVKDYRGLSTDRKPVRGVVNVSTFYEMDTRAVFMFDAAAKAWVRQ